VGRSAFIHTTQRAGKLRTMASRLLSNIFLMIALSALPSLSQATGRYALVIGNSDYKAYNLFTSASDANDMAAQLQVSGYAVFGNRAMLNLDRLSMERTIDEFAQSLPFGANAVVYFSGHGMATDRDNHLLPINSGLEAKAQIKERTVSLRGVVETMKSYNPGGINVMLLDISRSNPLTDNFLGVKNEFQKLNDLPDGTFIGYASADSASYNTVVADGVYTAQLLEAMAAKPNVSINKLHEQVATAVFAISNGAQKPVSDNGLFGEWCFVDCSAVVTTVTATPAPPATLTAQPATEDIVVKPTRNYWMIAGGVILGVAAIALASSSSGGSDNASTVPIQLNPPGQ